MEMGTNRNGPVKFLVVCDYPPSLLDQLFQTLVQSGLGEYILLRKLVKSRVHYPSTEVVNLPLIMASTLNEGEPLRLSSWLWIISYLVTGIIVGVVLVLRRRVDAILGVFAIPQGLVAAIVASLTGRKFVILTDGADVDVTMHKPVVRSIALWQLGKAFAVTAENNRKSAQLHSIGVKRRIIRIMTHAIDTSHFAPLAKKEKRTILFVGRLVSEKCPLVLVEALRILRERGIFVKLVMVGDGPLRTQIEKTAASLGLNELLTLKGYVPYGEVQEFYKKSAIFVLPSRREGVSSSLLEAMACECVCIASDIGDNLEVVRHMFNGLIFRLDDAEDLADQICAAVSLPDCELAKLTSNARQTVEGTYSVQVVGKALREILSELA
jgi:glycosyltransferase involved in cell wall biosynthesis